MPLKPVSAAVPAAALVQSDILRAASQLVDPNENEAKAVDARQVSSLAAAPSFVCQLRVPVPAHASTCPLSQPHSHSFIPIIIHTAAGD